MRAYESYAEALFSAAESLEHIEGIGEELHVVEELFSQCGWFLHDPLISTTKKSIFLRDALIGHIHPLTLEFLLLMLSRHHLKHLHKAIERFRYLSDRHFGKATVHLRIPYEMEPALLEQLKSRLLQDGLIPVESAGKTEFVIELDKSVIGGFIAVCDGMQIDASLKTKLVKLHTNRR